ncbi:MAG: ATP-dependent helicase, partial [Candidatus Omnitrophica bacterium]|nr:ATP-dependent helicase [Candidatus Omnitrophota bacterium]
QKDSRDLIKVCIDKTKVTKTEKFPKASVVQAVISLSINTNSSTEDVLDLRYSYLMKFAYEIEKIKELYFKKKKESNTMDYDDLLSKWKDLLKGSERVRKRFCEQFHYVMVDEYQDTNVLQADIINMLCGHHRNILAVGDDAQSIYSFRGACVDNILRFPEIFPGAKMFKLETNYRSTPEILNLANDSLLNNSNQFHKELKAVNPSLEKPALVEVNDVRAQAGFIAQRVLELRAEGGKLRDMAVLFRAHYLSAELEMELVKRGIPYIVRGGVRFFEQAHIKDVVAYIRIVVNPMDEMAWIRTLVLCPGIGSGYAEKVYTAFKSSGMKLEEFMEINISKVIPKKALKGYAGFRRIIRTILADAQDSNPADMIDSVLDSGYEDHLLASFENAKDRVDDIHELVNFSNEYQNASDFVSEISLKENFKGETFAAEEEEDQLVLSTIHQSKGLEWGLVFVIGLCEGHFPHPKAMAEAPEMEEERRLFYVAATRAKMSLYLIHPQTRYDHQKGIVIARRSRFLNELDSKNFELWKVSSGLEARGHGEDERFIEL